MWYSCPSSRNIFDLADLFQFCVRPKLRQSSCPPCSCTTTCSFARLVQCLSPPPKAGCSKASCSSSMWPDYSPVAPANQLDVSCCDPTTDDLSFLSNPCLAPALTLLGPAGTICRRYLSCTRSHSGRPAPVDEWCRDLASPCRPSSSPCSPVR